MVHGGQVSGAVPAHGGQGWGCFQRGTGAGTLFREGANRMELKTFMPETC